MILDNKNLFGTDPHSQVVHTSDFTVYIISNNESPQSHVGCGRYINPNFVDNPPCGGLPGGAPIDGIPFGIAAGKYNVTELMPLPVKDVNGLTVTYHASFSNDCDSTIQDFQVKTCTITNTAIEQ
jgi:hypothetical protein